MLTEQEMLVLCELADSEGLGDNRSSIGCLPLLSIQASKNESKASCYCYTAPGDYTYVVSASWKHEQLDNEELERWYEELLGFVQEHRGTGPCVLTGIGTGGLIAAQVAAELQLESIVFGAPTTHRYSGNVKNLIGEDDPVGSFLDKVEFIQQRPRLLDDVAALPLSKSYLFDTSGTAVRGTQSDYSKYCSWFYSNAGSINTEVWHLFFVTAEEQDEWIEKDIYAVFLRWQELNEQKVTDSMNHTIAYTENVLDSYRKSFGADLDKRISSGEVIDFDEAAALAAKKAADFVMDVYNSVETLLMGIDLYSLETDSTYAVALLEQFSERIDHILEQETDKLTTLLMTKMQSYIDSLSVFPDLPFEA